MQERDSNQTTLSRGRPKSGEEENESKSGIEVFSGEGGTVEKKLRDRSRDASIQDSRGQDNTAIEVLR